MTTILLDRDRYYAAVLARVASRRSTDEVVVAVDASVVPRMVSPDTDTIVVVDEEAADVTELLRQLAPLSPSTSVVVLVSSFRSSAISHLVHGARAVLHRRHAVRTLGSTLDAVADGLCAVPPELMRTLLNHFRLGQQTEENEALLARLSPREAEILELLVNGVDATGVSDNLQLSIHTVRSHLKHIFRKLGVHSTVEAVLVAFGAGMVPAEGPGDPQRVGSSAGGEIDLRHADR